MNYCFGSIAITHIFYFVYKLPNQFVAFFLILSDV